MYENIYTVSERKKLISQTLKYLRNLKHYTQKEVAEKLGINTEAYATYERGRNEPPAEMLVRLSFLYYVPIDVIVIPSTSIGTITFVSIPVYKTRVPSEST